MLSKEEVLKIASLARIELTEEEIERFQSELSAVLHFVGELNEIDTTGVDAMTGGTHLETVMRSDESASLLLENEGKELTNASGKEKNGFVEVKSVFE